MLRLTHSPESSNIRAFGYEHSKEKLTVIFKNGTSYEYTKVPSKVYIEMCEAESVGKYFNTIRSGPYPYKKLEKKKEKNKDV